MLNLAFTIKGSTEKGRFMIGMHTGAEVSSPGPDGTGLALNFTCPAVWFHLIMVIEPSLKLPN